MDTQAPASSPKRLNSEKLLGYSLLGIGLIITAVATILAIGVLTGATAPPKVFEFEAPTIALPQLGSDSLTESLAAQGIDPAALQGAPSEIKILPDDVFNGLVNMGVFYLAMMFLASSGAKVAGLGIKLIKDIKVQVRS